MLSLSHLSPPPPANKITACENDGQLRVFSPLEAKQKIHEWLGEYNVEVFIGQESARPAYSKYEAKEAFSAHSEKVWQRFIAAYYEEGVLTAIRQLSTKEKDVSVILRKAVGIILKVLESVERVKAFLPSPSRSPSLCMLDTSLQVSCGSVLSIAWHPHTSTLAAVYADDTIRVFGKGRSLIPLLKHRLQKNVSQIQWMPYCASVLAVGCEFGILLWTLDPISVVTRPSGSCLSSLAHPGTLPLKSLSWHPKGLTLACIGGKGRELVMWDVASENHHTVHSGIATSISLVSWAPDGNRLLAALSTAAIKVFESHDWSFERWSLAYPLQSAVWSSCGRLLLFVTSKEPILFCLSFRDGEGVGGASVAVQVADLSPTLVTCEDGQEVRVGGLVKQLAWDVKSERLAILFKDSEFIALFHTHTRPQLHLAPGGFIRGQSGEIPSHISFQNNVTNGAILTTVWSGGEVKHLPLRYASYEAQDVTLGGHTSVNRSLFASPTALNHSRLLNASLVATSPMGSPLPRLFSSP